jgi:hypothetical protein
MGDDPAIEAYLDLNHMKRYDDYTIPSFASFMGIDEATAKRWIRRGQVQRIKRGKLVYIPAWVIAKCKVYGVPEYKSWNGVERRTRQQSFDGVDRRKA